MNDLSSAFHPAAEALGAVDPFYPAKAWSSTDEIDHFTFSTVKRRIENGEDASMASMMLAYIEGALRDEEETPGIRVAMQAIRSFNAARTPARSIQEDNRNGK